MPRLLYVVDASSYYRSAPIREHVLGHSFSIFLLRHCISYFQAEKLLMEKLNVYGSAVAMAHQPREILVPRPSSSWIYD